MFLFNVTAGLIRPLAKERTLLGCVLVSIALHALVLFGMSRQAAPGPASTALLALTARLVPLAAVATASVPAQPGLAPRRVAEPTPALRPALIEPVASPAPAAQKAAPAAPAESAPASLGAADSTAQTRVQVPAAVASQSHAAMRGAEAGVASGSGADAGTLAQYRMALIVASRRYKRYPAIAVEKGLQGRVEVQLVIGASGLVARLSIKNSSGHEILDQQALEMLDQGKAAVPIPASLRGREFSIDIPVIFNLDNPNS